MKLVTHSFEGIDWLGTISAVSVVVFFILFIVIVYQVIRYDKGLVKKWEDMPFENDNTNGTDEGINLHS